MDNKSNSHGGRKRARDGDGMDRSDRKRQVRDDYLDLKILIPNAVTGAVIGKGAEVISSIKKDSGATVKISNNQEFYPGTKDRICMISGDAEGILKAITKVQEIIIDKVASFKKMDVPIATDRIQIVVTNNMAGQLIGKGGGRIKELVGECGSKIQISQPKEAGLGDERVVSITGDTDCNLKAVRMILARMEECPNATILRMNYNNFSRDGEDDYGGRNFDSFYDSRDRRDVTMAAPSPFESASALLAMQNAVTGSNMSAVESIRSDSVSLGNIKVEITLQPTRVPDPVLSQVISIINGGLQSMGYPTQATTEVSTAIYTLAKYGLLSVGLNASALGSVRSDMFSDTASLSSAFGRSSNAGLQGVSDDGFRKPYRHRDDSYSSRSKERSVRKY